MDFIVLCGVIIAQILAVYLDNLGVFSLIVKHRKKYCIQL